MSDEKLVQSWMNSVSEEMKGEVNCGDPCYERAVDFVKKTFNENCVRLYSLDPSYKFGVVGFRSDNDNLFDVFLRCLPEEQRQHYNCNTCKRFINRYGRLVIIKSDGHLQSAMWDIPNYDASLGVFADAIGLLRRKVESGRVIHLYAEHCGDVIGQEVNGGFRHFHAGPLGNVSRVLNGFSGSTNDFINECETNFNLLKSFLSKYAGDRGLEILKSIREGFEYEVLSEYRKFHDTLDDLEHVLKYEWDDNLNTNASHNKIWYHVMHRDSFVKIKNSVLGMLFDDLDSGMDFDKAAERFNNAVDPLHYRRPQALPTMTQVKEANKLIEELGLEKSFHRRISLVDEIPLIWKPTEVVEEKKEDTSDGGLFSNVPTKESKVLSRMSVDRPQQDRAVSITWNKFQRDVLPNVTSISVTMNDRGRYPFTTILTATYPDAKPILKYDKEDNRCPFSGYMRKDGSPLEMYHLSARTDPDAMATPWGYMASVKEFNIVGICTTPYEWADDSVTLKLGRGIIFLVEGADDHSESMVALFPELLIPELYPHRRVIESYSSNTKTDYDDRYETHDLACGLYMVADEGSSRIPFTVVTKDGTTVEYIFTSYE